MNDILSFIRNLFSSNPGQGSYSQQPQPGSLPSPTPHPTYTPQQSARLAQGPVTSTTDYYNYGFDKTNPAAAREMTQPTPTPTPQPTQDSSVLSGYAPSAGTRIPQQYVPIVMSAAKQYGVDPNLLASLLHHESAGTWNPKIKGPTGDFGLAEIVLKSHPEVSLAQAYDPSFAIPFAAKYLANSMSKFNDINRAIASYNVGGGGASISGNTPAGTGPLGQSYIDNVARNLTPELRKKLGIKTTY